MLSCGSSTNFQKQKFTHFKLSQSFKGDKVTQAEAIQVSSPMEVARGNRKKPKGLCMEKPFKQPLRPANPTQSHKTLISVAMQDKFPYNRQHTQKAVDIGIRPDTIITTSHDTILGRIVENRVDGLLYRLKSDKLWYSRPLLKDSVLRYQTGTHVYQQGDDEKTWLQLKENHKIFFKIAKILALGTLVTGLVLTFLYLSSLDLAAVFAVITITLAFLALTFFLIGRQSKKADTLKKQSALGTKDKVLLQKIKMLFIALSSIAVLSIFLWIMAILI